MDGFEAMLADGRVGLVAMTHMSNVLGTYTPAERIVRIAHAHGAKVLFDGAQAVVHRRVDVQALDCDFYAFTGHKLYGPTGIGVLWGRRELLDAMPPFLGGGEMISSVSFERSTWAEVPHKFEAGTPPILEGIGLKAAIDYVQSIGYDAIDAHEASLIDHAHVRGLTRSRACTSWAGRRIAAAWCRSRWIARMRTTWRPCWIARASRCAPAITAPNR